MTSQRPLPSKFQGDEASEQSCRIQLADDGLHIDKHADQGMDRHYVAEAGRCEGDKAEIEYLAIGRPAGIARDISQRIWDEIPNHSIYRGKHQPDVQIERDRDQHPMKRHSTRRERRVSESVARHNEGADGSYKDKDQGGGS